MLKFRQYITYVVITKIEKLYALHLTAKDMLHLDMTAT